MKKVLSLVSCFCFLLSLCPVGFAASDFADLNGHWAKPYVMPLHEKGIISGKSETAFDPEATVTRSEFLTLALKVARIKVKNYEPTFSDVAEEQWFSKTMTEAKKRGIIPAEMVVNNSISPDSAITREEMAAVLVSLWEGIRGIIQTDGKTFTDQDTISPWATESVLKAVALGVVTGNPDGSFAPKNNVTRAEMAVLFSRLYDQLKTPVVPTAAGEYSPVYKGIIREDLDINKLIAEAYAQGKSELTLEKAVYRVNPTGIYHIQLADMKDFTLDGNGSTFLFQGYGRTAIQVQRCENVTLKNFIMDFETTANTQAEIIAIDPDGYYYDLYIEPGYPQDFGNPSAFFPQLSGDFYDSNGMLSTQTKSYEVNVNQLEPLGGNVYRLNSPRLVKTAKGVEVGDYMSWRANVGHGIFMSENNGMHLSNITIYGSGNGVNEMYGNDTAHSTYDRVHLIPGPAPLGAVTPRIRGVNGTGFHFLCLRNSVHVTNSSVVGNGDDGFNVHGLYHRICEKVNDKKVILALGETRCKLLEGETLAFYTNDYSLLSTAKVVSAKKLTGYKAPNDAELRVDVGVWVFSPNTYYEVELDQKVEMELPGWVVNRNETCDGLIIKDTLVANGRARGMLIKSDSVIENCLIDHRVVGLMIAPELHWLESDYVTNILVKNTTIRDSGFAPVVDDPFGGTVHGAKGIDHENVVFEGCTFDNNYGFQLEVAQTQNATVKDCLFKDSGNSTGHITVHNVNTLNLSGNTFEGKFEPLKIGENVGKVNQ